MRVVIAYPPNYAQIAARFDIKGRSGIVFTYDGILYNPSGKKISEDLMLHESVHSRQQNQLDGQALAWWRKYLSNNEFRFAQELEAYRAQYKFVREFYPKQECQALLKWFAQSLSSKIYGNLCTLEQAETLIKGGE